MITCTCILNVAVICSEVNHFKCLTICYCGCRLKKSMKKSTRMSYLDWMKRKRRKKTTVAKTNRGEDDSCK